MGGASGSLLSPVRAPSTQREKVPGVGTQMELLPLHHGVGLVFLGGGFGRMGSLSLQLREDPV